MVPLSWFDPGWNPMGEKQHDWIWTWIAQTNLNDWEWSKPCRLSGWVWVKKQKTFLCISSTADRDNQKAIPTCGRTRGSMIICIKMASRWKKAENAWKCACLPRFPCQEKFVTSGKYMFPPRVNMGQLWSIDNKKVNHIKCLRIPLNTKDHTTK